MNATRAARQHSFSPFTAALAQDVWVEQPQSSNPMQVEVANLPIAPFCTVKTSR